MAGCRARAIAQEKEREVGRTITLTVFRRSRVIVHFGNQKTELRRSILVDVTSSAGGLLVRRMTCHDR